VSEAPFSLRYFAPAAPLRAWVSSYYLFETGQRAICDTLRAELPQLRFLIRGRGTFAFGDAKPVSMPLSALSGPSSVAARFEAEGPIRLFGMGLLPAGWAALVGADAHGFADQILDLSAVAGPAANRAWLQMAEASRARDIVGAADAFLLLLSVQAKPPPMWFTRAADDWLVRSADPKVDDLVEAVNMSARQVERMCLRVYGAPPKALSRKYRALQAAVRFGLNPAAGWEAAAAGAFYDQSHFIREFKTFVGMTPSRFVDRGAPWITRLTIAKRQAMVTMPKLTKIS
jgi:AraC-like DNA-binding protein